MMWSTRVTSSGITSSFEGSFRSKRTRASSGVVWEWEFVNTNGGDVELGGAGRVEFTGGEDVEFRAVGDEYSGADVCEESCMNGTWEDEDWDGDDWGCLDVDGGVAEDVDKETVEEGRDEGCPVVSELEEWYWELCKNSFWVGDGGGVSDELWSLSVSDSSTFNVGITVDISILAIVDVSSDNSETNGVDSEDVVLEDLEMMWLVGDRGSGDGEIVDSNVETCKGYSDCTGGDGDWVDVWKSEFNNGGEYVYSDPEIIKKLVVEESDNPEWIEELVVEESDNPEWIEELGVEESDDP